MIDFDALVFGPGYDTFGQPAVLTIGSSSYNLVVIDNTRGVKVDEGTAIGVQTVHPAADVRRSALNKLGIVFADLIDGEITFGGATWRIKSFVENGDELRLILMSPRQVDDLEPYRLTETSKDHRVRLVPTGPMELTAQPGAAAQAYRRTVSVSMTISIFGPIPTTSIRRLVAPMR